MSLSEKDSDTFRTLLREIGVRVGDGPTLSMVHAVRSLVTPHLYVPPKSKK